MQCLVGGAPIPPAASNKDEDIEPNDSTKRRRAHDNFNAWLADFACGSDCHFNEADGPPSGDDASAPAQKVGKRGRPMSEAAAAKAQRERARRERLNEYFEELARLCDPSGKSLKGDRVSVVADAIRVVQQLRVENNQLRQLNKFLEERTGALERSRAQAMFQSAGAMATAAQDHASTSIAGGAQRLNVQHLAQYHQQQLQVQPGGTAAPTSAAAPSALSDVQHILVQVPVTSSLGAELMALKQDHVQTAGCAVDIAPGTAPPAGPVASASAPELPPGAPAVSWLPAPDLTEDQKLRPPAA